MVSRHAHGLDLVWRPVQQTWAYPTRDLSLLHVHVVDVNLLGSLLPLLLNLSNCPTATQTSCLNVSLRTTCELHMNVPDDPEPEAQQTDPAPLEPGQVPNDVNPLLARYRANHMRFLDE